MEESIYISDIRDYNIKGGDNMKIYDISQEVFSCAETGEADPLRHRSR